MGFFERGPLGADILSSVGSSLVARLSLHYTPPVVAGIAQLVEQLICNQQVVGSNPSAGSLRLVSSR